MYYNVLYHGKFSNLEHSSIILTRSIYRKRRIQNISQNFPATFLDRFLIKHTIDPNKTRKKRKKEKKGRISNVGYETS